MNAVSTLHFDTQPCLDPDNLHRALRQASTRLAHPGGRVLALSVAISVAAHLAAMAALMPDNNVQIAGGAPATLAALGNSFADFTEGTLASTPPDAAAESPVTPTVQPLSPPEVTDLDTPAVQPPSPPEATTLSAPSSLAPVVPLVRAPDALLPETLPLELSALAPQAPALTEATPIAPDRPQPPLAETAPATPPETLSPAPEVRVQQADATSPRPQRRPEPQASPEPVRRAQTGTANPPQRVGNAEQSARRGTATGSAGASTAASGTGGTSAQPGNAAVSNYPGQVMERINRTRKPRVSGRGVAVVSFSVANNGGLAAASIRRSSGNSAIDAAALTHIRRAAPFPAPPPGAGRSFQFDFVVR